MQAQLCTHRVSAFVLGMLVVLAFSGEATACAPSDFALKQADWRRAKSPEYVRIVGELVSNCAEPAGVQLQAVFRDKAGKVVITNEFWPASTRNIAAHAAYQFSTLLMLGPEAATMSVNILEAKTWK